MQRSRSIVRVAFACSGHSTMPWWFVAAGNEPEDRLAIGRQVGGEDLARRDRPRVRLCARRTAGGRASRARRRTSSHVSSR